jgi:hypothetical protein
MNGIPERNPVRTPTAPLQQFQLPASTEGGPVKPMVKYARPYVEPFDPEFKPTDLKEWVKTPKKKE